MLSGGNFTNIWWAAFLYRSVLHIFSELFVIFWHKKIGEKAAHKMLVKLTKGKKYYSINLRAFFYEWHGLLLLLLFLDRSFDVIFYLKCFFIALQLQFELLQLFCLFWIWKFNESHRILWGFFEHVQMWYFKNVFNNMSCSTYQLLTNC